jgi:hypothetical protein
MLIYYTYKVRFFDVARFDDYHFKGLTTRISGAGGSRRLSGRAGYGFPDINSTETLRL